MLSTKFIVLEKKICKLLKQKNFLLEPRSDNAEFKNWAPISPRQSVKKLNQVVPRSLLKRMPPSEGRMLTSVFRYLNNWAHRRFTQQTKTPEKSKIWKVLRPPVRREERSAKGLWVTATSPVPGAIYPRFARGFNSRSSNPVDSPRQTTDGKTSPKESEKRGAQRRARRREEDYADITEQDLYTEEFSPIKLYSSLKRKREGAERREPAVELPPAHRCRLSCPLPPPNFFPPEKLEYFSSYVSPSVRFATLPLAFLSQPQKVAQGNRSGYTMRAREQKATKRARPVRPPALSDVSELTAHQKVRDRKNYLNLKSGKCQLYPPQLQLQPLPPPRPDSEIPTMKALLFDPVTLTLKCDVVNAPYKIFKDEVLVQVYYSGVCGSDLFLTEGKVTCGDSPIILGHEISGKVYAAGKEVYHVKPGDSIAVDPYTACSTCRYCSRGLYSACLNEGLNNSLGISKNGGWAEFVVVKKSQVHKIPDELGLDQGVLLLPLSCVLSAMSKLKLSHGMKIFIHGLGLSGCLWASLLHSRGFKDVLVSDKREKNRQKFESLNLQYTLVPPEDVRKFEADVVIECSGSPTSIEKCFNVLNPNGQMCFFGKPNPISEVRCIPYDIIQKEITIFGNAGNGFHFAEAIEVATSLGNRYLHLDKLGAQIFDLEDFREAFQLKKSDEVSKIIFKLDS